MEKIILWDLGINQFAKEDSKELQMRLSDVQTTDINIYLSIRSQKNMAIDVINVRNNCSLFIWTNIKQRKKLIAEAQHPQWYHIFFKLWFEFFCCKNLFLWWLLRKSKQIPGHLSDHSEGNYIGKTFSWTQFNKKKHESFLFFFSCIH